MTEQNCYEDVRSKRPEQDATVTVIIGYEYTVRDASGKWTDWDVLAVSTDEEANQFAKRARTEVKWRHQEVQAPITPKSRPASFQSSSASHAAISGLVFAAVQNNSAAYKRIHERNNYASQPCATEPMQ